MTDFTEQCNQLNQILNLYTPTGASDETARSEGLNATGIEASRKIAYIDHPRITNNMPNIFQAAYTHTLPPALLAGIASRESHCGAILDTYGWGDDKHAFGIFQIDARSHVPQGTYSPYSSEHINQAARILFDYRQQIMEKHPDWTVAQTLCGTVAAYNCGVHNIDTVAGMDKGTTHNDYMNDIWARAQYYAGQ